MRDDDLHSLGVEGPPPHLRERVLRAVGEELRRPARSRWRLGVAAAAVLLWVSLSVSVTGNLGMGWGAQVDRDRVEETARSIRDLAPDLPEREVYRQALMAQASTSPAPAPLSSPDRLKRRKEPQSWDTP